MAGVRPASTHEDRLWEEALDYDEIFQVRPGWSYRDVQDCPQRLLERWPVIHRMRAERAQQQRALAALQQQA